MSIDRRELVIEANPHVGILLLVDQLDPIENIEVTNRGRADVNGTAAQLGIQIPEFLGCTWWSSVEGSTTPLLVLLVPTHLGHRNLGGSPKETVSGVSSH